MYGKVDFRLSTVIVTCAVLLSHSVRGSHFPALCDLSFLTRDAQNL